MHKKLCSDTFEYKVTNILTTFEAFLFPELSNSKNCISSAKSFVAWRINNVVQFDLSRLLFYFILIGYFAQKNVLSHFEFLPQSGPWSITYRTWKKSVEIYLHKHKYPY